jgi:hypothetical protein
MRTVLGKLNGELLANLALQAGACCSQVEAAVAYAGGPAPHRSDREVEQHYLTIHCGPATPLGWLGRCASNPSNDHAHGDHRPFA